MKRILLFSTVLLFSSYAGAQHLKPCGTDEAMEKYLKEHPEEADRIAKDRALLELHANDPIPASKTQAVTYWIPVVFHILHQYGSENISDAQVYDAVRILNEDFQKLNADISQVVASFQGITADCQIGFRLARKDPQGNCTNGIDRIVSPETFIGDDGSKLNPWPNNKYLNIWVASYLNNGAAGYAYFPGGTTSSKDGIMITATYVGSIGTGSVTTSRALSHEVGHYLNLHHTWGSTAIGTSCSGSDQVSDTPPTKGWQVCNLSGAVCNSNITENVQNFMEYSYCTRMFTNGQKTRMTNALNSSVSGRNNLWKTANLIATGTDGATYPVCAPKADFKANTTTICSGSFVTFTDLSWNGRPTTWSWSFAGGTPSTSTDSIPVIQYNSPGLYAVTLSASNSGGTGTTTKTSYIKVISSTAAYTNWMYYEGYEGAAIPNADWSVMNEDNGVTWLQNTNAASSGTKSARIYNVANGVDQTVDELISPAIDLSAISNPTFTFKVAYAQKNSTTLDKLQVFLSNDCGQNWTQRYMKSGTSLATATATTSPFTPNSTQWRLETVPLAGFTTFTNMMFKFKFTSNLGNNVYIDDINLQGPTGLADEGAVDAGLRVFPNPSSGIFDLMVSQFDDLITIDVFNILGEQVHHQITKSPQPGGGQANHQIDLSAQPKGVYFLKAQSGSSVVTTKLVVE